MLISVLFVFALNDEESFTNIKEWMALYNENKKKEQIPQILLGNKCDLKSYFDPNLVDDFIKRKNIKYIKTSAKDKININESFEEIGKMLYQNYNHKSQLNKTLITYKPPKEEEPCFLCTP